MNPSSSTTGEMEKEERLHSPNPHQQDRGHIPSCTRLLHFSSDATSKKGQIELHPLPGPSVLHWKHLGSGREVRVYTFIHVVWEIALLMTRNTVALQPDFPAELPLKQEAATAEKTGLETHNPDRIISAC